MPPPFSLERTIETILREDWGRILACINKSIRDLQLSEDSLQDALEVALVNWKTNGIPKSPSAWLITTARRKAIDRIRRNKVFAKKQDEMAYLHTLDAEFDDILSMDEIPDKRLELIFTCCHPALNQKTKLALTLRSVGGLTTEEIAKAFLDDKRAMAQRLVRAKSKIKAANIPYSVPDLGAMPSRLKDVLSVIYLIFNEGYSASSGNALVRTDLSNEAIRLGRIMLSLMPDDTEIAGLLALMLLHDSRRTARLDDSGMIVPLEFQNRQKWNKYNISEGKTLLKTALSKHRLGVYQLQASISAVHVEAESWETTDWAQIAELYELSNQLQPSLIVRINQAMAVSYSISVEAAISMLDALASDDSIENYQSYYVARADLMYRSGQIGESKNLLSKSLELTENEQQRVFLKQKLSRMS